MPLGNTALFLASAAVVAIGVVAPLVLGVDSPEGILVGSLLNPLGFGGVVVSAQHGFKAWSGRPRTLALGCLSLALGAGGLTALLVCLQSRALMQFGLVTFAWVLSTLVAVLALLRRAALATTPAPATATSGFVEDGAPMGGLHIRAEKRSADDYDIEDGDDGSGGGSGGGRESSSLLGGKGGGSGAGGAAVPPLGRGRGPNVALAAAVMAPLALSALTLVTPAFWAAADEADGYADGFGPNAYEAAVVTTSDAARWFFKGLLQADADRVVLEARYAVAVGLGVLVLAASAASGAAGRCRRALQRLAWRLLPPAVREQPGISRGGGGSVGGGGFCGEGACGGLARAAGCVVWSGSWGCVDSAGAAKLALGGSLILLATVLFLFHRTDASGEPWRRWSCNFGPEECKSGCETENAREPVCEPSRARCSPPFLPPPASCFMPCDRKHARARE